MNDSASQLVRAARSHCLFFMLDKFVELVNSATDPAVKVRSCACACVHARVCMYVCVCVCVCMYACVFMSVCVRVHVQVVAVVSNEFSMVIPMVIKCARVSYVHAHVLACNYN